MSVQSKTKKRLIAVIAVVCVLVIIVGTMFLQRPIPYDYNHLITNSSLESGKAFSAIGSGSVAGMKKAAENKPLELYVNDATAEIAVKDTRSGKVWYSNPPERMADGLANPAEKDRLSSQLTISFFDSLQREFTYTSNAESIEREQFDIESIANGIRVNYTMGETNSLSAKVPHFITRERLEEKITSKLDKKKATYMRKRYVESQNKKGFLEIVGINLSSDIIMGKMSEILDEVGYTAEDLAYENEASGYVLESKKPFIKAAVEYRLKDGKLSVNVPVERMEYEPSMKLLSIELLGAFGAGSAKDQGYIVVPSGSGGVINFNNGKTRDDPYLQQIYGMDTTLLPGSQMQSSQSPRLPIFGVKHGDDGYLAYIESGASIASIAADVSGRKNSYNTVSPRFLLRSYEQAQQLSETKIVEKAMYTGDITVNYCFLEQDKADYSGMAACYRDILMQQGDLTAIEGDGAQPFYLDIIGSLQKLQFTVGVPNQAVQAMTTYKQANEIINILDSKGVGGIQLRYQGWFNRGVNHDVAKKINLDSNVGTKAELAALSERMTQMGGGFYPDVAFQLTPYNSKNYSIPKETARMVQGYTANIAPYSPAVLYMNVDTENGVQMLNSPHALPKQMDSFVKSFSKLPVNSLSVRDMGDVLFSDKNKKRPANREVAMQIVSEQMDKLAQATDSIMVSGGNSYALKYADHLIDVPTQADNFYIIDQEIPLYQMVVHGMTDYAGMAVNISENFNKQEAILRMVEYGASPHFALTYSPTAELSDSALQRYFSTYYGDWIDIAAEFYQTANEMNQSVRSETIDKHIVHENGLREVRYSNGEIRYINYTDKELTVDNVTVPAKSFAAGKGR